MGKQVLEYQTAKRQCSTLICQLQNTEFDLDRALVAVDTEHDIATFRVTHDQLSRASGVSFDCTGEWPPRMPEVDQVLQLVGFPENIRRVNQSFRGEYGAYGAFAAVEDVTPRDIIVTYDPQRDKAVSWVPEMPPLGYNMSGCSGGPALTHDIRNGLHRWHVVGMINSGPGNRAEGSFAGLDIIKIRRIDCIQSDGAIANVTGGW